jgi:hypothetical protein
MSGWGRNDTADEGRRPAQGAIVSFLLSAVTAPGRTFVATSLPKGDATPARDSFVMQSSAHQNQSVDIS